MTSGGGGVGGFLLSQESFLLCKLSRDLQWNFFLPLAVKHFCRERERERERESFMMMFWFLSLQFIPSSFDKLDVVLFPSSCTQSHPVSQTWSSLNMLHSLRWSAPNPLPFYAPLQEEKIHLRRRTSCNMDTKPKRWKSSCMRYMGGWWVMVIDLWRLTHLGS